MATRLAGIHWLAESHLCLQSRLAKNSVLRLYGKDCLHGDGSTISDLMPSPKRSRVVRRSIAWKKTKVLQGSVMAAKLCGTQGRNMRLFYITYFFFFFFYIYI